MKQTITEYIATIGGICGGDREIIITFRSEKKDEAIDKIIKRSITKKTFSSFMFELEYQGVTFRLFSSGRAVFRSVKNREELDAILKELLI